MCETAQPGSNSTEAPASAPADLPAKPKRSLRRRIGMALLYLVYIFILLEVASRIYWMVSCGMPLFRGRQILRRFYPHLYDSGVLTDDLREDDEYLDVLLLGGSVLEKDYGTVAERLEQRLAEQTGRKVRVYNLGRRGHSSRDSFLRYRELAGRPLDLVVVYHGINEVRMNCCPRSMFREDYSHVTWYAKLNRYYAYGRALTYLTLPYTAEYTVLGILGSKKLDFYLSRHRPKDEWLDEGAEIKTDVSLRRNLQGILDLAGRKGEPVVLMTFATHIPPDYSLGKFRAKKLDYAAHLRAVDLWGRPANVKATIAAHNRVIAELAASRADGVIFVDQQKEMPKGATWYNDCCHMTDKGCEAFVEHIVGSVARRLKGTEAGQ